MKKKVFAIAACILLSISFSQAGSIEEPEITREVRMMKEILVEMFKANPEVEKHFRVNEDDSNVSYLSGFGLLMQAPTLDTEPSAFGSIKKDIDDVKIRFSPGSSMLDSLRTRKNALAIDIMKDFIVRYGDLASFVQPQEKIFISFESVDSKLPVLILVNSINVQSGGEKSEEIERVTVEIQKKELDDLKRGKNADQQIRNQIKVNRVEKNASLDTEFRIFSKIMAGIVQDHRQDSWSRGRNNDYLEYQRLEGMGIIYFVDLQKGSPWMTISVPVPPIPEIEEIEVARVEEILQKIENNQEVNEVKITVEQRKALERAEAEMEKADEEMEKAEVMREERLKAANERIKMANQKLMEVNQRRLERGSVNPVENYKELETEIKNAMIEYGRTLRSLENKEMLVLKIDLPDCRDCDLPESKKLSVAASVLEDYDARKIELEAAVAKIQVEDVE